MNRIGIPALAACVLALGACGGGDNQEYTENQAPAASEQPAETPTTSAAPEAMDLLSNAANTVQDMRSDAELSSLLDQAKGVFVVPDYGKGAVVVGAKGGQGVLLANENGQWSNPAFYDIGGISVGAQIGGEGGAIAMLLMTDKAVNAFKGDVTFSLNANSGFTLVNYSASSQGDVGNGDVVLWSNTDGAFAGVSLGVTDINFDDERNQNYYGQQVTAQQILSGQVTTTHQNPLQRALQGTASAGTGMQMPDTSTAQMQDTSGM